MALWENGKGLSAHFQYFYYSPIERSDSFERIFESQRLTNIASHKRGSSGGER